MQNHRSTGMNRMNPAGAVSQFDQIRRSPILLFGRHSCASSVSTHLADRGEIVDSFDAANFEPFIARLERQPVNELHEAGNGFSPAEMGDIDSFDPSRRRGKFENFLKARQALARVDEKYFGLHVLV